LHLKKDMEGLRPRARKGEAPKPAPAGVVSPVLRAVAEFS
jgi:hypothetical protein